METDKENDSTMASDDEANTTDQLLDSTYNLKPPSMAYGKSPVGKKSSYLFIEPYDRCYDLLLLLCKLEIPQFSALLKN